MPGYWFIFIVLAIGAIVLWIGHNRRNPLRRRRSPQPRLMPVDSPQPPPPEPTEAGRRLREMADDLERRLNDGLDDAS